jgi:hypothetical protein
MKQIVVALNYVDYKDERKRKAQQVALQVLSMHPKPFVSIVSFDFVHTPETAILESFGIYHLPILKKDSSVFIQNPRKLPYIKEILNCCGKIQCDVFGYINSDILLANKVYDLLQQDYDAFIFSRSDIGEISAKDFIDGKARVIYGGDKHAGVDGFFFKKSWWDKNRDKFPDGLILGETEWDTCYRYIIKHSNAVYIEKRALYHVYHDAKWDINSLGGKNNRKIWDNIKNKKEF